MTTHAPAATPLSTDELAEVRCALRSGLDLDNATGRRLLATVDGLQKAIVLQAGRIADLNEPAPTGGRRA